MLTDFLLLLREVCSCYADQSILGLHSTAQRLWISSKGSWRLLIRISDQQVNATAKDSFDLEQVKHDPHPPSNFALATEFQCFKIFISPPHTPVTLPPYQIYTVPPSPTIQLPLHAVHAVLSWFHHALVPCACQSLKVLHLYL